MPVVRVAWGYGLSGGSRPEGELLWRGMKEDGAGKAYEACGGPLRLLSSWGWKEVWRTKELGGI